MKLLSTIKDYFHEKKLVRRTKNYVRNRIPLAHSQNHKYDLQTKAILKQRCSTTSNCVDVGCFKGDIMDFCLQYAPNGQHFGFEPIPYLYNGLVKKYHKGECVLHNMALSNETGTVEFHHVVSDPGYSGLKERKYTTDHETINKIQVRTDKLDNIIPANTPIDFIKIDVEGGEFLVLKGAQQLIARYKPLIVFEFDKDAADYYQTKPDAVYHFFHQLGMKVSLMENYLKNKESFTVEEFRNQFDKKLNYYFIAYPN